MNILFVTTFYYPNMQGGVEQVVKYLASELIKNGHNVAVYCADGKKEEKKEKIIDGVKVYRFSAYKFDLFKFSYDKSSISKLGKIKQKFICYFNKKTKNDFDYVCNDFKPDVIHTHTLYGITPQIWKWSKKNNYKVIHTIHDRAPVSYVQYGHKENKMLALFHKYYMFYYSLFVDIVTAPSQYTLKSSLEAGCFKFARKKVCIPNAVSIDKGEIINLINEKRKRTDKTIQFMYAGRLVYFKGIQHMIEAFQAIENARLHICGTGDMQAYVEAAAKKDERIIYHGKLDNFELEKVYKECDVMIVPSNWPEPFGLVVIEGNKYAMPVIAGNCGGIPEIIEKVHGGELYKCGDKNELQKLMIKFLNRKEYDKYYKGIEEHIDYYDLKKQINSFETLYFKLKGI